MPFVSIICLSGTGEKVVEFFKILSDFLFNGLRPAYNLNDFIRLYISGCFPYLRKKLAGSLGVKRGKRSVEPGYQLGELGDNGFYIRTGSGCGRCRMSGRRGFRGCCGGIGGSSEAQTGLNITTRAKTPVAVRENQIRAAMMTPPRLDKKHYRTCSIVLNRTGRLDLIVRQDPGEPPVDLRWSLTGPL